MSSDGERDETTLSVADTGLGSDAPAAPSRLALVIAWCSGGPDRVGEVAIIDPDETWILGRGEARPGGGERRMVFGRQRPSRDVATGSVDKWATGRPVDGKGISREQLRVRVRSGALEVTRIGRCPCRCAAPSSIRRWSRRVTCSPSRDSWSCTACAAPPRCRCCGSSRPPRWGRSATPTRTG